MIGYLSGQGDSGLPAVSRKKDFPEDSINNFIDQAQEPLPAKREVNWPRSS